MVSRGDGNFAAAARVAADLVARYGANGSLPPFLLNVNVPDLPYEALGPVEVTRLGRRHKAEPVVKSENPRGQTVYWVGAAGDAADAGPGTDFHAAAAGRISITPLQMDLTHFGQLDAVRGWLGT